MEGERERDSERERKGGIDRERFVCLFVWLVS